jgi:ubiquinone/menaquinone biosynthesis C-methylase UbiE
LLLAENVAHLTATDVAEQMIEIGKAKAREQNISNVDFRVVDVLNADISDETFDAVLAHNLLHLIEDLPTSLVRINKHLKMGGVFISKSVCAFGRDASWKFRLMKMAIPVMQFFGKAPFVIFRTIEDHEAAITAAGFKIVESGNFPKSPPSRYVVAIKQ